MVLHEINFMEQFFVFDYFFIIMCTGASTFIFKREVRRPLLSWFYKIGARISFFLESKRALSAFLN